jgi:hypothetical protein
VDESKPKSKSKSKPNPAVLAALAVGHVGVKSLTWRDIRRRTDAQVRGKKKWWRTASAMNTTNSLLYFVVGRRRSPH